MMKKLITLCLFTMALLLSSQSISAQEDMRSAEEIAKEKTYKLIQEFGLEGDQQKFVWRAFLNIEKAKKDIAEGNLSEEQISVINEKANTNFERLMKESLTERQYVKFNTIKKEYL